MSICLGLNFGHDGSACLVQDGKLLAAISTERITRRKNARSITSEVIDYLLLKANISYADIDIVSVVNWFWDITPSGELSDKRGFQIMNGDNPYSIKDFDDFFQSGSSARGYYSFYYKGIEKKCIIVDHHTAHCSYGFYLSPFDEAISVTIDVCGGGDKNYAIFYFHEKKIDILRAGSDFDIGKIYGHVTDYLGFYPSLSGAGKVMGLAAYGTPYDHDDLVWPHKDSLLEEDTFMEILYRSGIKNRPRVRGFFPQLPGEGGVSDPSWLDKKDWNSELSRNLAATTQAILEKSILSLLKKTNMTTKNLTRNLCLSGGTLLNCVTNGKILHSGLFDNVFLAPACGDEGLSIGAALYTTEYFVPTHAKILKERHKPTHLEVFEGGRRYSNEEILSTVSDNNSTYLEVSEIAKLIEQGKIVSWFYRGSEIGPRALGHRSIIANPCIPDMKDTLNKKVKHREEFRPFAPVVLKEYASEWFELKNAESPFMLFSVQCKRPEYIPAGTHIDGTSRVQTVDKENNGKYYELIASFNELTGIPILLNTSFNVQGEPIVESPTDAVNCFLGTNIDVLVFADVEKEGKLLTLFKVSS